MHPRTCYWIEISRLWGISYNILKIIKRRINLEPFALIPLPNHRNVRMPIRNYLTQLKGAFFITTFVVFSWSMLLTLWEIPSFLMDKTAGEIVGYISYQAMFSLFECLMVTAVILVIGLILPAKWIRGQASTLGALLAIALAFGALTYQALPVVIETLVRFFPQNQFAVTLYTSEFWLVLTILLLVASILLSSREGIARLVDKFVDAITVLDGVYVLIGVLSLMIVLYRNLF